MTREEILSIEDILFPVRSTMQSFLKHSSHRGMQMSNDVDFANVVASLDKTCLVREEEE